MNDREKDRIGFLYEFFFCYGATSYLLAEDSGCSNRDFYLSLYKGVLANVGKHPIFEACFPSRFDEKKHRDQLQSIAVLGCLKGSQYGKDIISSVRGNNGGRFTIRYLGWSPYSIWDPDGSVNHSAYDTVKELLVPQLETLLGGDRDSITDKLDQYRRSPGHFINSDFILDVEYQGERHINIVDLSVFVSNLFERENEFTPKDITELTSVIDSLKMFGEEHFNAVKMLKQTLLTSPLDAFNKEDIIHLARATNMFKSKDKSTIKLIQAGAYGYTYISYLKEASVYQPSTVRLTGNTDSGYSHILVNKDDPKMMEWLVGMYYGYKNRDSKSSVDPHNLEGGINPKKIQGAIATELEDFKRVNREHSYITLDGYGCKLSAANGDFRPTRAIRGEHSKRIQNALVKGKHLILTGAPGIGKTTAISNVLKDDNRKGKKILCIYSSPRIVVNEDFFPKIEGIDGGVYITRKSKKGTKLISTDGRVFGKDFETRFKGLDIVETTIDTEDLPKRSSGRNCKNLSDNEAKETGMPRNKNKDPNVREGIFNAIEFLSGEKSVKAVFAALSIQGLSPAKAKPSLVNFVKKLEFPEFDKVYIIIDELTGADEGLSVSNSLIKAVKRSDRITLILADASLVSDNAVERFFGESNNRLDKSVFISQIDPDSSALKLGVNCTDVNLQGVDFRIISGNCFPASEIDIRLHVSMRKVFAKDDPEKKNCDPSLDKKIYTDLMADFKSSKKTNDQMFFFIQSKKIIEDLLEQDAKNLGLSYGYLSSSQTDGRAQKDVHKNDIIAVTSRASRGISFPNVTHIVAEISPFDMESNLMELIQAIYRGRGDEGYEGRPKRIDLVLSTSVYEESKLEEMDSAFVEESKNSFAHAEGIRRTARHISVNMEMVKAAILTRVRGYHEVVPSHKPDKHGYLSAVPIGRMTDLNSEMDNMVNEIRGEIKDFVKEGCDKYKKLDPIKGFDFSRKWLTRSGGDLRLPNKDLIMGKIHQMFFANIQTNLSSNEGKSTQKTREYLRDKAEYLRQNMFSFKQGKTFLNTDTLFLESCFSHKGKSNLVEYGISGRLVFLEATISSITMKTPPGGYEKLLDLLRDFCDLYSIPKSKFTSLEDELKKLKNRLDNNKTASVSGKDDDINCWMVMPVEEILCNGLLDNNDQEELAITLQRFFYHHVKNLCGDVINEDFAKTIARPNDSYGIFVAKEAYNTLSPFTESLYASRDLDFITLILGDWANDLKNT